MKILFFPLLISLFLLGPSFANKVSIESQRAPKSKISKRKIQLVILFDTSNSMDGLLEQAKSRLWEIVNETGGLRHSGEIPDLEIAMYDYGNDGIRENLNYVRKQLEFTTDLDLVSKKLFGLKTNGGSEFCGAVIKDALSELKWSNDSRDLKMIFIAGNEGFNQGPVHYKEVCDLAKGQKVLVNTIYCGNREQGIRDLWKDGADCSKGDYFNINSNAEVVFIPTPYDDRINELSSEINDTYISYGALGSARKSLQMEQDGEALSQAPAVANMRAKAKISSNYTNSSWDLVDAYIADPTIIEEIDSKDLSKELKAKSKKELEIYVKLKIKERKEIQDKIAGLSVKREEFIKAEKAKDHSLKKDDFGSAVTKSIKTRAIDLGFDAAE